MGFIYKLYSTVDDNIYIGSTSYSLKKRFLEHKSLSKVKSYKIYEHFNRINWDNVRIELLEDVPEIGVKITDRANLKKREQHFFKTLRPSLNIREPVDDCSHIFKKSLCKICNGTSICEHRRIKHLCGICNGNKYFCFECDKKLHSKYSLKLHNASDRHKEIYNRMFNECFAA